MLVAESPRPLHDHGEVGKAGTRVQGAGIRGAGLLRRCAPATPHLELARQFRRNFPRGLRGIRSLQNRSSNHQIARAGVDRLSRRERAHLVVACRGSARADPRSHDQEVSPQRRRIVAISCGDATTPSRPASWAMAASAPPATRASARSRAARAPLDRSSSIPSPRSRAAACPRRRLPHRRPCARRAIIAAPPLAWTLSIHTPAATQIARPPRRYSGCRGTSSRGRRDGRDRTRPRRTTAPLP